MANALRCLLLAGMGLVSACATIPPTTDQAAIDYNWAFAKARDETLVVNILRAAEREPLIFSTIVSVVGGVRTGASLEVPFTNVIAGGPDAISPKVTFTAQNPNVTISPLVTKEFVRGLLNRVDPVVLDEFLAQGWRREVVLPLAIAGVVCSEKEVLINDGSNAVLDEHFRTTLSGVSFSAYTPDVSADDPKNVTELRMSGKDAAALLKDGIGKGYRLVDVRRNVEEGASADSVVVRFVKSGSPSIGGLDPLVASLCERNGSEKAARLSTGTEINTLSRPTESNAFVSSSEREKAGFILRSIQGMFLYLGNVHRRNMISAQGCAGREIPPAVSPLLFIRRACGGAGPAPGNLVVTRFGDELFFVPRGLANSGDHSAETLSALSELIALQTTEASLQAATPIFAVGQ